mgnify:CR=1 FL=1
MIDLLHEIKTSKKYFKISPVFYKKHVREDGHRKMYFCDIKNHLPFYYDPFLTYEDCHDCYVFTDSLELDNSIVSFNGIPCLVTLSENTCRESSIQYNIALEKI